ncbi:MAG: hypothetical protein HFE40_03320 [Clostridia bacterium]|jgi:predicted Holliday junction resolvase-like endonuclease|nr:hypothetical protein [Clostridia bacterium]
MDAKYIVVIACGSLFLLLFLVYIILSVRRKKREAQNKQRLEQMYSDKNLVKMEYDFVVYDEETEKLVASKTQEDGQMSISDIDPTAMPVSDNAVFQKVDTEGLEEIVGNYKPE